MENEEKIPKQLRCKLMKLEPNIISEYTCQQKFDRCEEISLTDYIQHAQYSPSQTDKWLGNPATTCCNI